MNDRGKPPFQVLADMAGRSRMQGVLEATRLQQHKADYVELSGFSERVQWMQARALVMQERNPAVRGMVHLLVQLEAAIQEAITEASKR